MATRTGKILVVDTLAEKDTTPTNTRIALLICNEDGYLYRKVSDGEGGTIWGRRSTMSTSIYDTNLTGVVDDSEKLGGQLPSYYATAASLANRPETVNGVFPPQYFPPISMGNPLGSFASQAAMLAVTQDLAGGAPSVGDFGIRTDAPLRICVLGGSPASDINNWMFLDISGITGVASWAGRTGAVVPTKTDVGLANVDNTSDINKPVSTAQAAADTTVLNAAKAYNDTALQNLTTTGVPEGVNQYFTNTRADARADARIAASGLASAASVNLQNSSVPTWQRLFTGQFLTTDATLTPMFTSAVIPDGTSVWVDCTIHGQYSSGQGQAVLSMQGVVQKTSGSNIRMAQAVRLQTTGDLGLAIATCSVTLNTSLQKFIINVQGKTGVNIKWAGKIEINQFTMV